MPLSPADYRKTAYTHRTGLFSARPAANTVLPGTLYFCEDKGILYRSNGTDWTLYSSPSPMPAMPPLYEFDEPIIEPFTQGDILSRIANENIPGGWNFKNGLYERDRTTKIGEWIPVSYSSGDFTANLGATWTVAAGDVLVFKYMLIGTTLFIDLILNNTSITVAQPSQLSIAIPGGFTSADYKRVFALAADNTSGAGTYIACRCGADSSGTTIFLDKLDGSLWALSTDNTDLRASLHLEI